MYCFDAAVRYSEIDDKEKLSIYGLVNYFQDCSNFHSMTLNVGVDELMEENRSWILSYWQIKLNRMPKLGESVKVATWPYAFDGFLGMRNFMLKDQNDDVLAIANSIWVFIDTTTGRPIKTDQKELDAYKLEPRFEGMEYEPRKIKPVKDLQDLDSYRVRKSDLDTNNHMNNARYIQLASEYLPEDFNATQVRVEYKMSALLGDTIVPAMGKSEDGRLQIQLRNEEGKVYAITEWEWR